MSTMCCLTTTDARDGGDGLFVEGGILYAAMLASIRSARVAIRMGSYIFAGDEVGQSFAEALAESA
jgi:phosphatidylserine/phosphatidylglycerophosphate/cardiolipin synthase-like enzyme